MSKWSSPTKRRKKLRLNCINKVAYFTAEEAQVTIEEVRQAGKLKDPGARAYVCSICGLYHWGNRVYPDGTDAGRSALRDGGGE